MPDTPEPIGPRETHGLISIDTGQPIEFAEPEPRPDVPDDIREAARAAFAGQPPDADGQYVLMSTRDPWEALDDALAAVLPVLRQRAEQAERERDLAVAHDRQPYPTAWAYEQACKALDKHRARAEQAEAAVQRVRDWFTEAERPDCAWTRELGGILAALDQPADPEETP
jgi:hypothetical protein